MPAIFFGHGNPNMYIHVNFFIQKYPKKERNIYED